MKTLILIVTLFSSLNATAATDCRMNLSIRGGPWSGMNGINHHKKAQARLLKILENKGYEITQEPGAPFQLTALAGAGYSCGSGLSWLQRQILPVSTYIQFTHTGNVLNEKETNGVGLNWEIAEKRAIARTLREVKRLIPNCDQI